MAFVPFPTSEREQNSSKISLTTEDAARSRAVSKSSFLFVGSPPYLRRIWRVYEKKGDTWNYVNYKEEESLITRISYLIKIYNKLNQGKWKY